MPGGRQSHSSSSWLGSALQRNMSEDTSMDALTGANTKSGTLTLGDKNFKFPLYEGTIGPDVIDIRKLYGQGRHLHLRSRLHLDRELRIARSPIIDGDEGVLLYRGYPIEQLAEHGDFLETCYLLLYGELPTAAQKADFDYRITRHTMVHEQMTPLLPAASAATRIRWR